MVSMRADSRRSKVAEYRGKRVGSLQTMLFAQVCSSVRSKMIISGYNSRTGLSFSPKQNDHQWLQQSHRSMIQSEAKWSSMAYHSRTGLWFSPKQNDHQWLQQSHRCIVQSKAKWSSMAHHTRRGLWFSPKQNDHQWFTTVAKVYSSVQSKMIIIGLPQCAQVYRSVQSKMILSGLPQWHRWVVTPDSRKRSTWTLCGNTSGNLDSLGPTGISTGTAVAWRSASAWSLAAGTLRAL